MPDPLTEALDRLTKVNETIAKLTPEIRASAFAQLVPLIFGPTKPVEPKSNGSDAPTGPVPSPAPADTTSIEAFFAGLSHDKPAENVLAICAWLYSQDGVFATTQEAIEAIANRVGLTTPRRIDMTLNAAKREGKALFSKSGKAYSPTVHGELFLKQSYGVKKGIPKA